MKTKSNSKKYSKNIFLFIMICSGILLSKANCYDCQFQSFNTADKTYQNNVADLKCLSKSSEIKKFPSKISFFLESKYPQNYIDLRFYSSKEKDGDDVLITISIVTHTNLDYFYMYVSKRFYSNIDTSIKNKFVKSDWSESNYFEVILNEETIDLYLNGILKQSFILNKDIIDYYKSIIYFGFATFENFYDLNLKSDIIPENIFKKKCSKCPLDSSTIIFIRDIFLYASDETSKMVCPPNYMKAEIRCLKKCEGKSLLIDLKSTTDCVEKCPEGYFYQNLSCNNKCTENCLECDGLGCTKCKTGYSYDSSEKSCLPFCKKYGNKCIECNEKVCTKCFNPNNINSLYDIIDGKCLCKESCEICSQGCQNCNDGECLDKLCTPNCSQCMSSGLCKICNNGYTLNDEKKCEKTICEKENWQISGQCLSLDLIKDKDCIYFDKTIPTIKSLPQNICLKNQNLLEHVHTYNCYLNPIITNLPLDFKNYFAFSFNTDRNYYYIGYDNFIFDVNKIQCNNNIQSFSFFNIECNNSFPEAFEKFEENFQNIIYNMNFKFPDETINAAKSSNFFSDIIKVFVNECYKSISYENSTKLFQYALNSKEIMIDISNKKISNINPCKKNYDKKNSQYFLLGNSTDYSCIYCDEYDFFYEESAQNCFSSILTDIHLRNVLQYVIYGIMGFLSFFILLIIFILIVAKSEENQESSCLPKVLDFTRKDYMELVYSCIAIIDLITDFGYMMTSVYNQRFIQFILIAVFCFHPFYYFIYGSILYIKNANSVNNSLIKSFLLFFPFIFLYEIGSMTNLIGNKMDIFNFNMLLKYIGKDIDNLSTIDRLKMKYMHKLIDFFLETLPELVLQIYINNASHNWNVFNIVSISWTVLNIIQTCLFLLSQNINIKNLDPSSIQTHRVDSEKEGINK